MKLITHYSLLKSKEGQSLIEILIAVGIGGLVIGAATYAISFVISSNMANQQRQIATGLGGGLMSKVRVIADADWLDIYNLPTKSATSTYFVVASSSELIVVEGKEGNLSDDIINGLVGHWKFDEATTTTSTTTYDSSGNKNNGTLAKGSSATSTPVRIDNSICEISNCLLFNGGATSTGNYVLAPYSTSIDISGSGIALSAWVYLLGYPASGQSAGIIRHNGYSYGYRLLVSATNKAYLQLTGINGYSLTSATILPLNQWTHIVGVLDNGIMKIYINSVQDPNTKSRPGNVDPGSEGVYLGQTTEYSSINGYIDDARIYNRALSADEIQRLYNSQIFTRSFAVENVNRDASDNIVTSGGNNDPSTQKITATIEWSAGGGTPTLQIIDYVTRWKNRVFNQSDWSGGSGQEGPLTEPNDKFSSSTNIDFSTTPGSIKINL